MNFYTLKVVNIIKETNDTVTLCFKQPGLKRIKYQAGQYLTLIFRINGRRYIRPYSFSSSPECDPLLEVTIKRVAGGVISNHINDVVKIGDSIEVMQPMGDFTFTEHPDFKTDNIYLWGAGSGITPLISIAKYTLFFKPEKNVTLVYGNRSNESVIFKDQILHLQKQFKERFTIWHFHTQLVINPNNPYLVQGRIAPHKVLSIQNQEHLKNSQHFICGPSGLKESVKEALQKLDTPSDRIKTEEFELIRDPRDFENIHTQNIEINFNNKLISLEVIKGKSILEAGLDSMVELPYSCQTGSCITCKGKLISGELKMIGVTKIPEGLEDQEYLLCCSHPTSENVKIIIN